MSLTHDEINSVKTDIKEVEDKILALEEQTNNYKYEEHILNEHLSQVEKQIEREKLYCQSLYRQIENINRQKTMAEIAYISEEGKINSKIEFIKQFGKEFDDMAKSKPSQLIKSEEKVEASSITNEIADIEKEIVELEKSCIILKKRNAAILLRLRKDLKDSEIKRRALMQSMEKANFQEK